MKSALFVSALLATLCLELVIAPNLPTKLKSQYQQVALGQSIPRRWEVTQEYQPPDRQAPEATVGGSSRGSCLESRENLTSLMPPNNLGLTTEEYPTLFWYVPKSTAEKLEFKLQDGSREVYKRTFRIPSESGVISFTLPKSELAAPLEVGKMYHWYFTIICPTNPAEDLPENSGNAIVDGWIERSEPSATLVKQLDSAAPSDRPALYAAAGIWHDSLTTLAELRRRDPNNRNLAIQWKKLLISVGLDEIVEKPMLECCKADR